METGAPVESNWLWCLHCERAFLHADLRKSSGGVQYCAYEDCYGVYPYDMILWFAVRRLRPTYPEVPEPGVAYPVPPRY
jgi:hypothetical protein